MDYDGIFARHGLKRICWAIIDEQDNYLVVKHRVTGTVKYLKKGENEDG